METMFTGRAKKRARMEDGAATTTKNTNPTESSKHGSVCMCALPVADVSGSHPALPAILPSGGI